MAEKKVTRKELLKEPDEFLTLTGKSILYFKQNPRQVTLAAVILVVCGAVAFGFYSYNTYQEKQSHEMFQKTLVEYYAVVQPEAAASSDKLDFNSVNSVHFRQRPSSVGSQLNYPRRAAVICLIVALGERLQIPIDIVILDVTDANQRRVWEF